MMTRRAFFMRLAALGLAGAGLAGYAVAAEPSRLRIKRHRVSPTSWPKTWPEDLTLRIAALSDLHACEPWMNAARVRAIAAQTNDLGADVIVLLGDYTSGHRFTTGQVHSNVWSRALSELQAPLGVYAVLGNHDWWEDRGAQKRGHGPVIAGQALERAGIRVLENDALRLTHNGRPFWLAGLGDQLALLPRRRYGRKSWRGVDDMPRTLARLTDDAPAILLAHEPDIFPKVPDRFAVTLSGHTHGGQVRLFGHSPVVPSAYGNRYAYGHVTEGNRHLVVSGGLGCSIAPIRFGVPPEITVIEITRRPLRGIRNGTSLAVAG